MSLRQKHIQSLAHGFRVAGEIQPLHHRMDAAVACATERDEIVHRVVLSLARNAFAHAVNVVDAKVLSGPAFAAGVTVARHDGFLVAAERLLVAKPLSRPLLVLSTERAALGGFQCAGAVDFALTAKATRLWPSLAQRIWLSAVGAIGNRSKWGLSRRSAHAGKHLNIVVSARSRATGNAEALGGCSRFELYAAPLANARHVSAARHAPRLHLARSAALKISARRLNCDAAIGAANRLVFRDCSHEQNVVGAFPNG